jgi:hypothetical protein
MNLNKLLVSSFLIVIIGLTLSITKHSSADEISPGNELIILNATGIYNNYKGELWFKEGTSVETIKSGAEQIKGAAAKKLIRNRVDRNWSILLKYIPFPSKDIAYAYLMGNATLESKIEPWLETAIAPWGTNAAHAYGVFQTAETAFKNTFYPYTQEIVPDFPQAPLQPYSFFFDPVVSTDMGLRKMCWFAIQARKELIDMKGFKNTDPLYKFGQYPDFWALILKGFNTGHAIFDSTVNSVRKPYFTKGWYNFYGVWAPTLAQWYLNENHLTDAEISWHEDPRAQKYAKDPFSWITSEVKPVNMITPTRKNYNQLDNVSWNSGSILFSKPAILSGDMKLSIYNASGQHVFSQTITHTGLTKSISINQSIPKGFYVIKLFQNNRPLFIKDVLITE